MNDADDNAGDPGRSPSSASAYATTESNAQASLARPPKMPAGAWPQDQERDEDKHKKFETRNWCMFFFFRIMRQAEMDRTEKRLAAAIRAAKQPNMSKTIGFLRYRKASEFNKLKLDLAFPGVLNGGLVKDVSRTFKEEIEAAAGAATAAAAAAVAGTVLGAADGGGSLGTVRPSAKPGARALPDLPAKAFRAWLNVLVSKNPRDLRQGAEDLAKHLTIGNARPEGMDGAFGVGEGAEAIDKVARQLAVAFREEDPAVPGRIFKNLPTILDCIRKFYRPTLQYMRSAIQNMPSPTERRPEHWPHGCLAQMVLYEVLRQGAPIFVDEGIEPVLRSEAAETDRLGGEWEDDIDCTPITMAFSFPGLKALKLDDDTLASFPEAFKDGMAARARRLGDVGRSAPENWEGELGLRNVHGYFTGGSNLERHGALSESFWKELRREIRLYNDPTVEEGGELRAWIGLLFRMLGLEIVHIELGQDPYKVDEAKKIKHIRPRVEHFGFRDGLSQPFVDLGLGDTPSGGGTADRRGTWSPVAPGEIFLDRNDETGQEHKLPLNPDLREGSTYLVFRKLEQDVEGFRAFLEQQRPNDERAQKKLAAQFLGRWPNGTSLVHSPQTERSTASTESEAALNDFRYAADDPLGRKCPLGAHVRRANPRDIGGRNDVRHHRILRRGIAYGGPLLSPREADGEKRGILFVCANARIDLQFEVVQGDWLNGGEFLGQAGLGRCPIAGAQDGSVGARFLEAGAAAPVTGLPSFVTMRGGDYFFAPGIKALKGIAQAWTFKVPETELPYDGAAMGEAATPSLFGEDRMNKYWDEKLRAGQPVRVEGGLMELSPGILRPENVTFVGWYNQVKRVLSNDLADNGKDQGVHFSVEPYLTAGRRITRGEDFLVGTDTGSPLRERLLTVLNAGWDRLSSAWEEEEQEWKRRDPRLEGRSALHVRKAAKDRLDAALRRTGDARRIDLVEDLAAQAAYGVLDKVLGIRGPRWLSELAGAIPFSRQHIGDLPPDWIAAFKGERPTDPGLKTMQVWSIFLVADLIGNYGSQQLLQVVARQAGSEMLNHIDLTLAQLRARGLIVKPKNLIEAFLYNGQVLMAVAQMVARERAAGKQPGDEMPQAGDPLQQLPPEQLAALKRFWNHYAAFGDSWPLVYQKDVTIILLEIVGSTLAVVPLTFASVMKTLLNNRFDLSLQLPRLRPEAVAQIVYEGERLSPNSPIRFRRCKIDADLGKPGKPRPIAAGDFVAAVISKANMDRHVFWQPERFSLGERFDPLSDVLKPGEGAVGTCPRDPDKYLLFGVKGSNKHCWGSDRVAMPILEECIYACGRLQGLRGVAGSQGKPQMIGSVTIGLPARFNRVAAKDVREMKKEVGDE